MQTKILATAIQSPKGVLPRIGAESATLLSGLHARANHNDSAGQICAASQGSKSTNGSHINYKDPQQKAADSPAPSIIPLTHSEVGPGPCEIGCVLDNAGSLLQPLSSPNSAHSQKAIGHSKKHVGLESDAPTAQEETTTGSFEAPQLTTRKSKNMNRLICA
ncbi:hypothetical protein Ancab_009251 [Ancistrocladus abbreviatus]